MKLLTFKTEKADGHFAWDHIIDNQYIKNLKDGKYLVEIKKRYKKRTKAQNRWYWEVIKIIGNELGYEKNELHEAFKAKFLDIKMDDRGLMFTTSTTGLTTKQMNEYWEAIARWAAQQGIHIPNPNTY